MKRVKIVKLAQGAEIAKNGKKGIKMGKNEGGKYKNYKFSLKYCLKLHF